MRWRGTVLGIAAAVCIGIAPRAAAAQSVVQRDEIARVRDSLARSSDTLALKRLELRVIDSARNNRDDPMLHLRLGFLGLRLGQLTGNSSHLRDAEGEFEWATQLKPAWPLGWYGLGTAELLGADLLPPAIRGVLAALGQDIYQAPARDLAQSLRVDSTFSVGLVQLADDALRFGMTAHLALALNAMRSVGAEPGARNPDVLLQRGRIEREVGDADSAIIAFQTLLDRNRFDPLALFEIGRTRLAAGRISGGDQWYLGLALADSATAALYRRDLMLVMSDSALKEFDAARGQGRVLVARRFWDSRDPDAMNGSAERLREHYRRIDYAHAQYPLVPRGHRYDSVRVFDQSASLFDDRGRIYVRHGEPDDRTSLNLNGLPPNETWLYRRPAGDLLFNFAQPDSAQGYRLYESLLDIVGLGAAAQRTGQGDVRGRLEGGSALATYGASWTAQAAQELLYSRTKLSPIYARMLREGERGAKSLQQAERIAGRKSIATGLQTDSWKFGYELPMTASVDVIAVGANAQGPQIQVAFAIPGSSLYAPPSNGPVTYPIRMRVAVRNTAGDVVTSLDTLRVFSAAQPIPETKYLLGRLPIRLAPGDYTVRVAIETQSRGLVAPPRTIHVAAVSAAGIELSDLALGARTVPLPWRVGSSDTAWINPLHMFRATEPMQLYFEVGGIAAGDAYRSQLAIFKAGQKTPQLQVGFDAVAAGIPDRVHREIDVGRLGTGDYVLELTVSTAGGGKAVRQRQFTIVK